VCAPPTQVHSISLVAAGGDVPLAAFARSLATALGAIGPTLH